jgi:hypothetical protein
MAKKKAAKQADTPLVFDLTLNDTTLAGMVKRRASEAQSHWNKEYDLDKVRERNKKLATGKSESEKLRDERYQDIYNDNVIFKAKHTILSFISSRVTQPEVTPSDAKDLSYQFAQDFEKVLIRIADEAFAKAKIKLCESNLLDGSRVAVLQWVFNSEKSKLELEYCPPDSVIIGSRSGLLDEPDFMQRTRKRTVAKLLQQFPDKKDDIYKLYGIDKGIPSQLEVEHEITENWIFVEDEDVTKLGVVLMAEDVVLGKMSDPNWLDNGDNFIDEHMMPFVFFNFLNDGSGYIDNTSFIEQAMYNQQQYNKRGQTIAENANYAGIGVPVFGKGAIKEETASRVQFNPTQRILLDTEDVGKGFTIWQAGQLQPFVFESQQDLKQSIMDAYGTNSIQSGQESDQKTLGQDLMLRNQAEGRQQELIDAIDTSMMRFYKLEAQMIYRYLDEPQFFNMLGEDGGFEQLVISQKKIRDNIGATVSIKNGTNMPVDRSQKIAVAKELASMNKIGTLRLYKEFGIEDPQEAYKEYIREQATPLADLSEMNKDIQSREAQEDLQLVIGGKPPIERDDIDENYVMYLNDYLLKKSYEMLKPAEQQRVSAFVADVIAQMQAKQLKLQTQQPLAPPSQPPLPGGDPNAPAGSSTPAGVGATVGVSPTPGQAPVAPPPAEPALPM